MTESAYVGKGTYTFIGDIANGEGNFSQKPQHRSCVCLSYLNELLCHVCLGCVDGDAKLCAQEIWSLLFAVSAVASIKF